MSVPMGGARGVRLSHPTGHTRFSPMVGAPVVAMGGRWVRARGHTLRPLWGRVPGR